MKPKSDSVDLLPPLIFPGKTAKERKNIATLKKLGRIRTIGPKLYTSVPAETLESVVRGSWSLIVSKLFPTSLISHITALTYLPTKDDEVFLTSSSNRTIKFPGLTVRFMRGPSPLQSDAEFMGMKASSFERALLENLAAAKGTLSNRVLTKEVIEGRLEDILRTRGEEGLNIVRDKAHEIAIQLNMEIEFRRLDRIIGALLGTKSKDRLQGDRAIARAQGFPFDANCFSRLEILFGRLRHLPLKEIEEKNKASLHFSHKAFFESYFSNYIEGTIFEVKEAERIVFDNQVPAARPADAHDILSTYKIVSDQNEMNQVPKNSVELEKILKTRHKFLFENRPEIHPGDFKIRINQAGSTIFVHPEYVRGTLQKGFELYKSLPSGLARAIFMMFFISDIHPFNDGNGRISRIMMNAELHGQGLSTIIIPTVYRSDYISNLKALSRRSDPENYVRMLSIAHEFSSLDFSDYPKIKNLITSKNWFMESEDAKIIR